MIKGLVNKLWTEKGVTITIRIDKADIDADMKRLIKDIDGEVGYLSANAPDADPAPSTMEGGSLPDLLYRMEKLAEKARLMATELHGPEPKKITEEVRQPDLSGLDTEGVSKCASCPIGIELCGNSIGICPPADAMHEMMQRKMEAQHAEA